MVSSKQPGQILPVVLHQGQGIVIAGDDGIADFVKHRFVDHVSGHGRHQVMRPDDAGHRLSGQQRPQDLQLDVIQRQLGLLARRRSFRLVFFPFMFGIYPYAAVTEKQRSAMQEAGVDFDYLSIYELTLACLRRLLGESA